MYIYLAKLIRILGEMTPAIALASRNAMLSNIQILLFMDVDLFVRYDTG